MIEFLTAWILEAFFIFAPKMEGGRMGTVQNRDKTGVFPPNFFPNLRNFLFFSSPTYDLRPATYCCFPLAPIAIATSPIAIASCLIAIASALIAIQIALGWSIIGPGF